jgi:hypothetical protein
MEVSDEAVVLHPMLNSISRHRFRPLRRTPMPRYSRGFSGFIAVLSSLTEVEIGEVV